MTNTDSNNKFYIRSSRAEAAALNGSDSARANYNHYTELSLCVCFIDQIGSSKARYVLGPKDGYIRSECFVALIKESVAGLPSIRWIKEIGDEVMLVSESFRDLLEALLIADNAAYNLETVIGNELHPFGIRAAVGFGPIKRINRPHEDYIGTQIDQLARIMSVRSLRSNVLLSGSVMDLYSGVISEYGDSITVSGRSMLSAEATKGFPDPIYYHELMVNRAAIKRSLLRT